MLPRTKGLLIWVLMLVLVLAVGMVGCRSGSGVTQPREKMRVALVLPSTIDDMAWSQSMYEALRNVQNEMGADRLEIAVSERLGTPVEGGAAVRQYADQGYDIVIAHGAQFQQMVFEIARDFPRTSFAYGAGYETGQNVFAYDVEAQEGGYLLGLLAGWLTKSGIIGIVGPVEAGHTVKYNWGFRHGVAAARPDAKVRVAYTGSFNDVVGAGNLARVHMDAGADILTGSSQQAVGAIRVAAERPGILWLSTEMDQSRLAPGTVLASQVYRWESIIRKMIDLRKQGVLGGQHMTLTFAGQGLELRYNPSLVDKVPAEVRGRVEDVMKKIREGTLKIEVPSKK